MTITREPRSAAPRVRTTTAARIRHGHRTRAYAWLAATSIALVGTLSSAPAVGAATVTAPEVLVRYAAAAAGSGSQEAPVEIATALKAAARAMQPAGPAGTVQAMSVEPDNEFIAFDAHDDEVGDADMQPELTGAVMSVLTGEPDHVYFYGLTSGQPVDADVAVVEIDTNNDEAPDFYTLSPVDGFPRGSVVTTPVIALKKGVDVDTGFRAAWIATDDNYTAMIDRKALNVPAVRFRFGLLDPATDAVDLAPEFFTGEPVQLTPPGKPTTVTAVAGNGSAVVSWSAPTDGGTGVRGYEVTSSPGGRTCATTGTTSCTVTGLTNGTAYTFTVRASNTAGTGPASVASASVTPRTVPGSPTAVKAVSGNASASVSWTATSVHGGAAITGYTVTAYPGLRTCTTTGATKCSVTGLANGTSYTFTVAARNILGLGTPSLASAAVTPRIPVTVTAARAGYGDLLAVNVNPDKGAASYTFQVQRKTSTGSWSTVGSYATLGTSETRTVKLGAGTFRVSVPASGAYGSAVSPEMRLTAPTVKVVVGRDSAKSKIIVNVDPNKGSGYWTFKLQKRRSNGTWATLSTTYKTSGSGETRTIDKSKGIYRVVVAGKYGYRGAASGPVTLIK